MSCYEWEHGEIVIPTAEWAPFKKHLRDHVNKHQERLYNEAIEIYGKLIAKAKDHRGFKWYHELDAIMNSRVNTTGGLWRTQVITPRYQVRIGKMCKYLWGIGCGTAERTNPGRPRKPMKKDFPMLTNRETVIRNDSVSVRFLDTDHTVTWNVPENNHACESAHQSILGQAFFTAIDQVNFTRGSGGVIVGNDEYNRDSYDEGGGGNTTNRIFGPRGKDIAESVRLKRATRRYKHA
jgi:hypothetical protein